MFRIYLIQPVRTPYFDVEEMTAAGADILYKVHAEDRQYRLSGDTIRVIEYIPNA